jgi:hypothetical protein
MIIYKPKKPPRIIPRTALSVFILPRLNNRKKNLTTTNLWFEGTSNQRFTDI